VRALYWKLRELDPRRYVWQLRRAVLLVRLRLLATWFHSTVEVDIAPDVRLGRRLRLEVLPDSANVLRIGARSLIGDDVRLMLKGGQILMGEQAQIRHGSTLNVSGRFELQDGAVIGYQCFVHCAESVVLEPLAGLAELVTIADSSHYFTTPDAWFYENVRTAPVRIGANTWLCPRVSVASGVTIGSHCIIAANSLVTKPVPDGQVASGVPIDSLRELPLRWRRKQQTA
jgi:acetyltransferase-like isoleucine patch superfamily enzyme